MGNSAFNSVSFQCFRVKLESVLIASTCVSIPLNLAIPAWYASISFVQTPVKAAGKKASTTAFLPRKSDSFTCLLFVSGRVKSGASSPALSCVFGGAMFCEDSIAPIPAHANRHNSLFMVSLQTEMDTAISVSEPGLLRNAERVDRGVPGDHVNPAAGYSEPAEMAEPGHRFGAREQLLAGRGVERVENGVARWRVRPLKRREQLAAAVDLADILAVRERQHHAIGDHGGLGHRHVPGD